MNDDTATDQPQLNPPQQGIVLTATYILTVNGDDHEVGTAQSTTPEGDGCHPAAMVSNVIHAPTLSPTTLAQAVTDVLDETGTSCNPPE